MKLSGKAGYFGNMMKPSLFSYHVKKVPGYLENSGYIMELMRMKAWELGLGTCWLNIEMKKNKNITGWLGTADSFCSYSYPYKGIFKKIQKWSSRR